MSNRPWVAEGTNMLLRRRVAAVFLVLALAGCASVAGPGQAPNAPYLQSDPRDISGMH
jgi:hypothetical protein